jgi:predicted nucleic acid-binding protein
MAFVLDASVAACWCYHDEEDPRADAAFARLDEERAVVPVHWWFEVRNVVLVGERRKRITEQYSSEFLDRLNRFPIDLAALPEPLAAMAFARRHRLTFYDAAYLELAKRESVSLATLDDALSAAARSEGVPLIGT